CVPDLKALFNAINPMAIMNTQKFSAKVKMQYARITLNRENINEAFLPNWSAITPLGISMIKNIVDSKAYRINICE
ncbi:unnamed protein product, partial [marine sediment metagenome]